MTKTTESHFDFWNLSWLVVIAVDFGDGEAERSWFMVKFMDQCGVQGDCRGQDVHDILTVALFWHSFI